MLQKWQTELRSKSSCEKIECFNRFFKTGKGQYGEGDVFIGLSVPDNRAISRHYYDASPEVIREMLDSPVHEFRLAAFLALVEKYRRAKDDSVRRSVTRLYIDLAYRANNWDLVDLSAPYIIGAELCAGRSHDDIDALSSSTLLWHRRIAVVSTLTPVRSRQLDEAFDMCGRHIADSEPLMQKAVGWVLRECGKKDRRRLNDFLERHIGSISATSLSYATEKFTPAERTLWRQKRKHAAKDCQRV